MTYSKPEVKTLGEATAVIEFHGKINPPKTDGLVRPSVQPAYDLDE